MLQIAPHRYQSNQGALEDIGEQLESLGERALIIANKTVIERFEDVVQESLKDSMIGFSFDVCLGECCLPEIERLVSIAEKQEVDMIIGMGGGKTLDVAKYVAQLNSSRLATVPTVAGSCAAFTNIVHLYSEDGKFIKEEELDLCPDLLLLDYKIAGLAPSRHLAAGMSLSYSTAVSAGLSFEGVSVTHPQQIAFELTDHVRGTLLTQGKDALGDVKKGELTAGIETVAEIIVMETGLINCLGGGLFRRTPGRLFSHLIHSYTDEEILFGELVAFGTLVEKNMKNSPVSELKQMYGFYRDIEVPLTLNQLGLPENQRKKILETAIEEIIGKKEKWSFTVDFDADDLMRAIKKTDQDGKTVNESGLKGLEE